MAEANTREDSILDYRDGHGPQRRPASIRQIEAARKQQMADEAEAREKAAQKQVEADATYAKSLALPDD